MSCRIDHIDLIFITPFTDAFFVPYLVQVGSLVIFHSLKSCPSGSLICVSFVSPHTLHFLLPSRLFTRCRNVVLFYPGMLFLIDCFSGTQLFITYAAVGISGIPCATASRFFLVSDLWFMACGVDRMVLSVSTCLTDVSCDSVGCASRCT